MKLLVLHAHPRPSASIVNRAMLAAIRGLEGVTLRDLYALYPTFAIDVAVEQQELLRHDIIVLQFPLYWYSTPAILKEWLDLVLESGWAYGPGGTRLAGKFLMAATSTGAEAAAYRPEGSARYGLDRTLTPLDQTAYFCGMGWLSPFAIEAGRRLPRRDLAARAAAYRDLLTGLRDGRIDPLSRLADGYRLPPGFAMRGTA
jgi:glutathione-regulated potassium-efflux system ancillary protein KefG